MEKRILRCMTTILLASYGTTLGRSLALEAFCYLLCICTLAHHQHAENDSSGVQREDRLAFLTKRIPVSSESVVTMSRFEKHLRKKWSNYTNTAIITNTFVAHFVSSRTPAAHQLLSLVWCDPFVLASQKNEFIFFPAAIWNCW